MEEEFSKMACYQNEPDTVGEIGSSGEARGAGGGARGRPEPGGEPLEVDRGCGRHVLQVGLGRPVIAAAARRSPTLTLAQAHRRLIRWEIAGETSVPLPPWSRHGLENKA
jgi:hypothetical protein